MRAHPAGKLGEGATVVKAGGVTLANISIHAPREGGDIGLDFRGLLGGISIHAPREGVDYTPHCC